ncbi:YtxH-like protein [Mariniflexile rhizosphaerae]|uniref:YtxH domain-containing protein n=1 Tax=unclassified Mariniflexile TaxID=2643887 RepID=UPI000CC05706|nr:YtxH domain-containing protein [Mariniflexile sp. TRM1-10]AXP79620.1 YtxH-like protein [Mariniflexile sp. TRM1-10]PLB18543.1 MAG: hypothetical protein TRG1_2528 [Flavobacteriaceae bacterium FS1-H7996/R]
MKTSKAVIGVLSGVAVGAALGVLFAPDKGSETRNKIAKKSKDIKDKAVSGLKDVADSVSNTYHSVVSKGEELVNKGEKIVNEGKEEIKQEARDMKGTVREQMNK